ncbi:hypothetical protein BDR06DRAFT_992708 [Suillus hirtellus]|nr:hypothetical protein BDR06DRAFT_992708 [Suillus hirtellus]
MAKARHAPRDREPGVKSSDVRESGGLFEWAHLAYARVKDMNHAGLTSTPSVDFAKRGLQTPNLSDDVSAIENTRVTYWSPAHVPENINCKLCITGFSTLDMKDNPRLIPIYCSVSESAQEAAATKPIMTHFSWGKKFVAERSVDARYGRCVQRGPAEVLLVLEVGDPSGKTQSVLKWKMHENAPAVGLK